MCVCVCVCVCVCFCMYVYIIYMYIIHIYIEGWFDASAHRSSQVKQVKHTHSAHNQRARQAIILYYIYIYISLTCHISDELNSGLGEEHQRMLTYAHACSRMLTYAHVCSRMLPNADVCKKRWDSFFKDFKNADVCGRMLTYADVC
jgi:hypothetical protein